uniref:Uncharacterized protein n=1 Tax=Amphimedon queenslandica TaxID=400682 RepID=A0A1X7TA36_AMPQE
EEEKKQVMTPLFYEQVLPAVTNMLQSHTTIRLLRIECRGIYRESSQPNWIELVQHLYETIFIHPSLEYIEIKAGYPTPPLVENTLKDQKKTLIDRHRKERDTYGAWPRPYSCYGACPQCNSCLIISIKRTA